MAEPIGIKREGEIAQILLNRPEAYNAFDLEMVELLANDLIHLSTDDSVSALVISGTGKAFCTGGDLKWVVSFPNGPEAAFHELAARFHQAVLEIRRMRKPIVAAINGIAAGGGFSLALACDFRMMAKSAVLRQGYTANGLSIDGGGTFILPRLVGLARAMEIIAFDQPISAEQALGWGLATKVLDDEGLLEESLEMARQLSKISRHSFGWCKELMTDSFNTSFETQIERERLRLSVCATHIDGQEGLKAFKEKRKPIFNVKGG